MIFVANFKMFMGHNQTLNYCIQHFDEFKHLSLDNTIIICPSFISLANTATIFANTQIHIGAQDCSAFFPGAHTGKISAETLQEIGCTYCIVGHNEQRHYSDTNESVAEKTKRLLENNVTPIICIGEDSPECILETTYQTLEKQLDPVLLAIKSKTHPHFIIAYEPAWSIGTNNLANKTYLNAVFEWLNNKIKTQISHNSYTLLYGGSVDRNTIQSLCTIKYLNGFLIGRAATNFTELQSIIKSCHT